MKISETLEMASNVMYSGEVPFATPTQLVKADVIFGHEFGDQKNVSETSRSIAKNARRWHQELGIPVIFQHPCELAFPDVKPVHVIRENLLHPGKYLDTNEVQRQLAEFCFEKGWTNVILCCHPKHAWRAGLNLMIHGLTPVFIDNSNVKCDLRCSRWSMKSEYIWLPREVYAKFRYFMEGKISLKDARALDKSIKDFFNKQKQRG